jgi:hypothetical protein
MNLRVLKKSRTRPKPGDVFALQLKQEVGKQFRFGKVIRTDASIGPIEDTVLIYVYRAISPSKTEIPPLDAKRLLIAPLHTNYLPWREGYFEVVGHESLNAGNLLRTHCFWDPARKKYYDDDSNELASRVNPVGVFALHSYFTIDRAISKALGLPVE